MFYSTMISVRLRDKMSYYLHPFKVFISYPDEDIGFASNLKILLELMGVSA